MNQFAAGRNGKKFSIRYVAAPRNQRNHKVASSWAFVATVKNGQRAISLSKLRAIAAPSVPD